MKPLSTTGISSIVLSGGKYRGHIFFGDYDHVPKTFFLKKLWRLDGISCVLESSPGSYHLVNFSLRTKYEIGILGLNMGSDALHHAVSWQRSNWIVRIGPKYDDQGEIEVPRPRVIEWHYRPSTRPQCRGHLKIFEGLQKRSIPGKKQKLYLFLDNVVVRVEKYLTLSKKKECGDE